MAMPRANLSDVAIKQAIAEQTQHNPAVPAIAKEIVGSKDVNGSAPRKIDANKVLITEMANRLPEEFETDEFKQFMVTIEETGGNNVPINVYKLEEPGPNGEEYGLVYGHRRTVACQRTNQPLTVIVIPRPSPRAHVKAMVVENDHRDNVAPYGKAIWIASKLEFFDSIFQASKELQMPDSTLRRYKRIADIPQSVIDLFENRLEISALGADKIATFMANNPDVFKENFERLKAKNEKIPFAVAVKLLTAPAASKAAAAPSESAKIFKDAAGNDFAQMKVNRQKQLRFSMDNVTEAELKKIEDFVKRLRG